MISLGKKIISKGRKVAHLQRNKKPYDNSAVKIQLQCENCGNWFQITLAETRAIQYCSQCL